MSLTIPTTATLTTQIVTAIQTSIGQTIPLLPKSFTRVLAKVLAAVVVLLYKYAGWLYLQLFPAYASDSLTTIGGASVRPLRVLGNLYGAGDPDAATRAELIITVTVTTQTGTLPSGSQLLRSETGVVYATVSEVALNAATVQATIRPVSDPDGNGGAGTVGNLIVGDEVSFANPLANVASIATVLTVSIDGADGETVEEYRTRVQERCNAKPQGGAYADYRQWGEAVAGVLRIFPYTADDPGQTDLYVEATATDANPDGLATVTLCDAVLAAIELVGTTGNAAVRPANAAVNTYSIVRTAFDVEVQGLVTTGASDDATTIRAAVDAGVDEWLRSREPYIVGLSVLPRKNRITQPDVGGVVSSVLHSYGASASVVELQEDAATLLGRDLDAGERAKLNGGACSWV